MDRALIVSSGEKATAAFMSLIRDAFPECAMSVCSTGNESRRAIAENSYDAIVINWQSTLPPPQIPDVS